MYHYREWKDVTEFTYGCDLAQRPGVHLRPWTDVVQDFYPGTKPDCSQCCRSGRVFLQVITALKSPFRSRFTGSRLDNTRIAHMLTRFWAVAHGE